MNTKSILFSGCISGVLDTNPISFVIKDVNCSTRVCCAIVNQLCVYIYRLRTARVDSRCHSSFRSADYYQWLAGRLGLRVVVAGFCSCCWLCGPAPVSATSLWVVCSLQSELRIVSSRSAFTVRRHSVIGRPVSAPSSSIDLPTRSTSS